MEVRQELLFNVTAACNYDESNKNAAEVAYWGNYEALSCASHREDCDRSSTDY